MAAAAAAEKLEDSFLSSVANFRKSAAVPRISFPRFPHLFIAEIDLSNRLHALQYNKGRVDALRKGLVSRVLKEHIVSVNACSTRRENA